MSYEINLNTRYNVYIKLDGKMNNELQNHLLNAKTIQDLIKIKNENSSYFSDIVKFNIYPEDMRKRIDIIKAVKSERLVYVEVKKRGSFIKFIVRI